MVEVKRAHTEKGRTAANKLQGQQLSLMMVYRTEVEGKDNWQQVRNRHGSNF